MNFSRPFIERPVMTSLVMVAILFFGILSYLSLPVSDLPSIDYPTIQVSATNPGSDAETMASTVATILEKQFMMIDGLQSILSSSFTGQSNITLVFDLNKSIVEASTDVEAAINRAQGNLPPEMPNPPTYQKYNPSASPIIFIALSSDTMTAGELYDYANSVVGQQINMVPGAAQVIVYGSKTAVRVKVNPDIMAIRGVGINQVSDAIQAANQNQAGGTFYDIYRSYAIQPQGQLIEAKDYDDLIVTYRNGAPLRIRDLGKSEQSTANEFSYISFWNNKSGTVPTAVLAVIKAAGTNSIDIINGIKALLPGIQNQLPSSVKLSVISDSSTEILDSVHEVQMTLFIAFILVVLVIFLFIGKVTATIIPSVVLPLSIIGTFILMKICGFSIDILSLLGLTLVVGFLVDDAIVVLENIDRHMQMKKSSREAAMDGSKQIGSTIVSMTLSLSAVFIPLLFMAGIIGRMFHEFAWTVVISVLFSGFISLSLTPMLCSRFLSQDPRETKLEMLSRKFFRLCLSVYEPLLKGVLHYRIIPVACGIVSLVIAGYLFVTIPQDFLPPGDTGIIQGVTLASEGTSSKAVNRYQKEVNDIIIKNPHIQSLISAASIPTYFQDNQGVIYAVLKPINERPPISQVVAELNRELTAVIGMRAYLQPLPQINLDISTSQNRANYQYVLSTITDADTLYKSSQALLHKLQALPELMDVSTDLQMNNPQLNVNINRDKASSLGISVDTIETALYLGFSGGRISTFNTPIDIYNVIVEMEDPYRFNPDALKKLYVASITGELAPIPTLASWDTTLVPIAVNHVNQFPSVTINFNTSPKVALGTALSKISAVANEILPETIARSFQGQAQIFQSTVASFAILMFVGIAVIYLILGILYENFLLPLTILSALPGAGFGALVTLLIFGMSLSIYAYVGIIVLIGIVMKNGIMLVEFANENVAEGKEPLEAIYEACKVRFRPILMTTIAAIMGALPIAIGIGPGGGDRRPLGLTVVGGLIIAQLITLFFTPVIYLYLEKLERWLKSLKKQEPSI